jgi:hypothetical protein
MQRLYMVSTAFSLYPVRLMAKSSRPSVTQWLLAVSIAYVKTVAATNARTLFLPLAFMFFVIGAWSRVFDKGQLDWEVQQVVPQDTTRSYSTDGSCTMLHSTAQLSLRQLEN